jgi:hypothetical protein
LSSKFILSFFSSFILHLSSSLSLFAFVSIAPILFSSIKLYGTFALIAFLYTYFLHLCFLALLSSNICFATFVQHLHQHFLSFFLDFLFLLTFSCLYLTPFFFFWQVFKDIWVRRFLPLFFFSNLFFFFCRCFVPF